MSLTRSDLTAMTINHRFSVMLLLALSAACDFHREDQNPGSIVVQATYNRALDPENVVIRVRNDGDGALCIPISETELGGGQVTLEPKESLDYGENRPPARILGGLDISDGLYVLPAKSGRDIFLRISNIERRRPRPSKAFGSVRFVGCRSLFDGKAEIGTARFSVGLE